MNNIQIPNNIISKILLKNLRNNEYVIIDNNVYLNINKNLNF